MDPCIFGSDTLGQLGATVDTAGKQLHVSNSLYTVGLVAKQLHASGTDSSATKDIAAKQLYAGMG